MVTTISFPVCQRFPDILQNWRDCEHGWIANSVVLLVEKPEATILVQMWNGFGMQCKWTTISKILQKNKAMELMFAKGFTFALFFNFYSPMQ